MTRIDNKTDQQLAYIVKDCREAVKAMPENVKSIEYLTLATKAERELNRRWELRRLREELRIPIDRFNLSLKYRRHWQHCITNQAIKTWRNAALDIGLRKLHLT